MKVVLMAGGRGTRISELFPDIPKPLIPIQNMPVLEREIISLREQGFTEIILTVEKQRLLNTYVNNVTLDETLDEIDELIHKRKKSYIVAINVDVVMKMESDDYLRRITNEADMVLVDGKPLIWISKLHKCQIKEKVSGSDLVPQLCKRAADKNYSIFIIGGKDGVAEQAKKKLEQKLPGIRIVGTYAPPLGFENDESELDKINQMISDAHPDLLIGCLGCPKQEKWMYENYMKYDATVSV